jgi:hypothetical protein
MQLLSIDPGSLGSRPVQRPNAASGPIPHAHVPNGSQFPTGSPAANPYVFSPPAMPMGSVCVNCPVAGS